VGTRLQAVLRRVERELGLVVLLVTLQLVVAFSMGERIAVMRQGCVEQVGPIADVFRRPATKAVAEIMGSRNLLRARVPGTGTTTRLDWDGLVLEAPPSSAPVGAGATAYIRPEDVKLIYPDRPLAPSVSANIFDATITLVRQQGSVRVLQAELPNGRELEIRFPLLSYASLRLEPGASIRVALRRNGLTILDAAEPVA
jgi:molybdate transport system ATP-binding protein